MTTVDERLTAQGLDPDEVNAIIDRALAEDLGPNRSDPTSEAIFPLTVTGTADLVARESGVVAGLAVAEAVFKHFDPNVAFTHLVDDGARVYAGDRLATVAGPVRYLLMAERTVLNLLCRMSGIATHTREWTRVLDGTKVTVLDTRKTTPGLRTLDKYAVRAAGGGNKRMGLYDVAMIKDNHKFAAGSVTAAFEAVRAARPDIAIQVEVDTLDEAREAVAAGATFLLCDNMSPAQLREVVAAVGPDVQLEATGNITLTIAEKYADTGVDYISSGALTHSSPILDIALDIRQE
ncbi:carboxylating nicotinate-nucleotide diphosphorylase [Stackebrandtia nassauensis]|uniref:Nicotinate-nucleotide pyrophosphorylase [carboxylating] n=1 Tax=Stackebrandtia nassauensis (strain DSM 44728 / CIP 108903 / NRRL B-16338 / NBRC 102104 / LLR-40K-21) TaxID=446470 RepID=D3Q0E0_STANL|nr:carboxylating nicotinate-nucleotide diphosphorylase [Stackebrandtia nassauensis]ADD39804.1 nicotinate-nucleotide pyrophosphorylase [Stackebrandtia nassauensis DSM 44728]